MTLTHVEIDLELGIPALPPLRLVLQSAPVRGPIRKRRGRDRQRARRQQRHPRVVQLQRLLVLKYAIRFSLILSLSFFVDTFVIVHLQILGWSYLKPGDGGRRKRGRRAGERRRLAEKHSLVIGLDVEGRDA